MRNATPVSNFFKRFCIFSSYTCKLQAVLYLQMNTTKKVVVKIAIRLVRNVAVRMSGTVCFVRARCYYRDRGKGTLLSQAFLPT